jgi:hypothetical protein
LARNSLPVCERATFTRIRLHVWLIRFTVYKLSSREYSSVINNTTNTKRLIIPAKYTNIILVAAN